MTSNEQPWTEPGRYVDETGAIRYEWPPQGRFAELWRRFDGAFSDDEKHELLSLTGLWRDEHSTLVSFTTPDGEWVHVQDGIEDMQDFLKKDNNDQ